MAGLECQILSCNAPRLFAPPPKKFLTHCEYKAYSALILYFRGLHFSTRVGASSSRLCKFGLCHDLLSSSFLDVLCQPYATLCSHFQIHDEFPWRLIIALPYLYSYKL